MPVTPSEAFLTRKAGPLPVYAWAGLSLAAAYAYSKHKATKTAAGAGPAAAPAAPAAAEPGTGSPYFVIENNMPPGIHDHSVPVPPTVVPPVTVTPPTTIPTPPVNTPPPPPPPSPEPRPTPQPPVPVAVDRPPPVRPTPTPSVDPNLHYTSDGTLSLNDLVRNNPATPRGASGIIAATAPSEPSDVANYLRLGSYAAKLPRGTRWNIPRQGT